MAAIIKAPVSSMTQIEPTLSSDAPAPVAKTMVRPNGRLSKITRAPFRTLMNPNIKSKSWDRRKQEREAMALVKAKENELKQEKEEERQRRIQAIKDKKAAKEEKERYELLAQKMHAKRVERLRRREKRNKALKER